MTLQRLIYLTQICMHKIRTEGFIYAYCSALFVTSKPASFRFIINWHFSLTSIIKFWLMHKQYTIFPPGFFVAADDVESKGS